LTKGSLVAGKYRIIDEIGRGGMGIVYDAEDTILARRVAIKVLPEIFSRDQERMARFEREAKLLASLNHPNIASIHGLEEADEKRFLVMELVEGETLAVRIGRGPLGLEETRDICLQIADGVGAAHDRGIVHRDLKPSNIKLTPEGKVKVLDFGLAKALAGETPGAEIEKSPAITEKMTEPGVILGTAAYMSPEQAKGKLVDKRTDIWAFGCILYECLTGKCAFQGETVTETLAAILKSEPNWGALPVDTPVLMGRLIRHCLDRDKGHRLSDIHDAGMEIKDMDFAPASARTRAILKDLIPRHFSLGLAAILIGLTALATLLVRDLVTKGPQPQASNNVRFAIPDEFKARELSTPALDLSRDGSKIVFVGQHEGRPAFFFRALDRLQSTPLEGTEDAAAPFFSPDGLRIGFFADGKLKSLAISGGAPTDIGDIGGGICGSWGTDDMIVFAPTWGSILYRVPAAGGAPMPLTELDPDNREISHLFPQALPGGRAVVFTIIPGDTTSADDSLVAVQIIGQKGHRILVRGATYGRYLASGHLVYERKGSLLAVPFDLNSLEIKGIPVKVLDDLHSTDWTGVAHFAVSDTGTLLYASGTVDIPDRSLAMLDLKGHADLLVADKRVSEPAFFADGRIAMRIAAANDDIWVYTPERQQLSRVTFDLGDELDPVWTPDGKRIIYCGGRTNILWRAADGSGDPKALFLSHSQVHMGSVSPDGEVLAFMQVDPKNQSDIRILPLKGQSAPRDLIATSFNEECPRFSPNGRWLAYASDESGRYEVYLQSSQGPEGKRQVSTQGGLFPAWSNAGDRLFFMNGIKMMATDVDPGTGKPGPVVFLFERQDVLPWFGYDIGPGDDHFVMVVKNALASPTELRVFLNWFDELKRLVPTGKK